ncbi:MAG: YraN family protein [Muribaculaceae bacterium]|nr:YraN family protein [Muribaculaceae bacterium]
MDSIDRKKRDLKLGRFAEDKAAEFYIKEGYAVLERNWFLNKTEIDLIVQKGNIIAFVEVKARSGDDEDAVNAVSRDKMKRMIRASDSYIRSMTGEFEYRFDIIAFTGDFDNFSLEVFEDAFITSDIL